MSAKIRGLKETIRIAQHTTQLYMQKSNLSFIWLPAISMMFFPYIEEARTTVSCALLSLNYTITSKGADAMSISTLIGPYLN